MTQADEWLYGTPQSRLEAGVVTVDEGLGSDGGAGGAGGSDDGVGGSAQVSAGAGGYDQGEAGIGDGDGGKGGASTISDGGALMSSDGGDLSVSGPRLSSGCGCKLGAKRETNDTSLGLFLLAAVIVVRRRRHH